MKIIALCLLRSAIIAVKYRIVVIFLGSINSKVARFSKNMMGSDYGTYMYNSLLGSLFFFYRWRQNCG